MDARSRLTVLILLAVAVPVPGVAAGPARAKGPASGETNKPFGLSRVIAFYGAPKDIGSADFVLSADWKYWKSRGGVASRGITHQQFLRKGVDEAANVLANLDIRYNEGPDLSSPRGHRSGRRASVAKGSVLPSRELGSCRHHGAKGSHRP